MDAAVANAPPPMRVRADLRLTPVRLIGALTLLALAFRLVNLGGRDLWLDEAFSAWFSERSFAYLWTVLPTYEAHPPLYYSLLKIWGFAFGDGAAALRAFSVLLGAATIPLLMLAAFEQEREEGSNNRLLRAGLVGFLAAASPMFMFIGQEARPYALLTFAFSVAILAMLRLMRQFRRGEPGRSSSWLLFGASAELTAWSHGLGILYVASLAVAILPAWFAPPMDRRRALRGCATAAAVAAAYLPCLVMMLGRKPDWSTNWLVWRPSMLFQLVSLYSLPFEMITVGSALAAVGMLVLLKRGVEASVARPGWNSDKALVVLWIAPPLLAALISWLVVPVFLERTLSAALAPAYLAIGSGIARTGSARERRIITMAICIILTPLAIVVAARPSAERWDQAASFLSREVSPHDQLWLYPSDSALPLSRIAHLPGTVRMMPAPFPTLGVKGPIRGGWPAMVSVTSAQADRLVRDPSLKAVPVVWLLTRQSGIFDPDNDMPKALAKVRRPGRIESWGYISVQRFYRAAD